MINLEEKVKFIKTDAPASRFATKRDILREALPILIEMNNDENGIGNKAKYKQWKIICNFLVDIYSLIQEKKD